MARESDLRLELENVDRYPGLSPRPLGDILKPIPRDFYEARIGGISIDGVDVNCLGAHPG
jgi:hypothetical protein